MKKKLFTILATAALAVVTVVSLVACGGAKFEAKGVTAQINALMEVKSGQSDVAIIDSTMAGYLINKKDGNFTDLKMVTLSDYAMEKEYYGVAAKKGDTALINFINEQLVAMKDTKYSEVATKYGLQDRKVDMKADQFTGSSEGWKDQLITAGKVVIGYTENAPMGITNDDKTVSGFDIDLAREIFTPQGITVEAKIIDWDSKVTELNSDKIDLVWNGMTINPERQEQMAISIPYLTNEQAIVVKASNAENFTKFENLRKMKIAVEEGSAGYDVLVAIVAKMQKDYANDELVYSDKFKEDLNKYLEANK